MPLKEKQMNEDMLDMLNDEDREFVKFIVFMIDIDKKLIHKLNTNQTKQKVKQYKIGEISLKCFCDYITEQSENSI